MTDTNSASETERNPQPDKPRTIRLVIRAEIIPDTPVPPTAPPPSNRRALAVTAVVVAVLALTWIASSLFRSERDPEPAASADAPKVEPPAPTSATAPTRMQTAPVVSGSAGTTSAKAEVQHTPAAPHSPINEVLPNPSRSALQTIRGTVKVTVRVTIDQQGTVIAASPEDPGPSRYFERLSVDAAKRWTFTASGEPQRTMLLRFHFTRDGTTARSDQAFP